MDEVTHTILPNGGGLSGTALGAGFGGLIGSWLGNGFGGFGGGWNRGGAAVGYDTGAINAMQGQLNSISSQINAADRDFLMQTANQNQFVGNLVNQTWDQLVWPMRLKEQNNQNKQLNQPVNFSDRFNCSFFPNSYSRYWPDMRGLNNKSRSYYLQYS